MPSIRWSKWLICDFEWGFCYHRHIGKCWLGPAVDQSWISRTVLLCADTPVLLHMPSAKLTDATWILKMLLETNTWLIHVIYWTSDLCIAVWRHDLSAIFQTIFHPHSGWSAFIHKNGYSALLGPQPDRPKDLLQSWSICRLGLSSVHNLHKLLLLPQFWNELRSDCWKWSI